MVNITEDLWYWHHNVSECYYYIQLTIKYRRSVFQKKIKNEIVEIMSGFKERYYINVHTVGYDKKHNIPVIVSEISRNKKAIMGR